MRGCWLAASACVCGPGVLCDPPDMPVRVCSAAHKAQEEVEWGRPLLSQLGKEPQTCHLARGGRSSHWHLSLPVACSCFPASCPFSSLPSPSKPRSDLPPTTQLCGPHLCLPHPCSPTQLAVCPLKGLCCSLALCLAGCCVLCARFL